MVGEIFGDQGLIVLAVILVMFFGGTKIPQLARSLGQAKKQFQEGLTDDPDAVKDDATVVEIPAPELVVPPVVATEPEVVAHDPS